jgi:hypothetical protein
VYEKHPSDAKHYLADVPVEMPLEILLALPDYAGKDRAAPIFNLPAAVSGLLGQFGWERASRILSPKIWAPAWTPEQIYGFATSPFSERPEFFEGVPGSRLVVTDFPGTGDLRDTFPLGRALAGDAAYPGRPGLPEYDIVHFIGAVEWKDGDRALRLSEHEARWLPVRNLLEALQAARTRLLILHVGTRHVPVARDLARSMVDLGGPTVLVAACTDPGLANTYFADVYAGIVHNNSLESAAEPKPWILKSPFGLSIDLYHGQGGSEVLRFDRWLESLSERTQELKTKVESAAAPQPADIAGLRAQAEPFLHRSQTRALDSRLEEATERLTSLRESVAKLSNDLEIELDWDHESGGAEPLSKIADIFATVETEAAEVTGLYPGLKAEVDSTVENAPRVLNANFADPAAGRLLQPSEGLLAGQTYDLLVDIGPRWNKVPTIVTGHAEFPADAMPPDPAGHVIDVVLVSDDFTPQVVSGKIWLPRSRGRSHPWKDGKRAPTSGPVALRVTAPAIENPRAQTGEARARAFLYYENNLLQSAIVTAGVVREAGIALERKNEVLVDYVLTGTFHDVESQYARRKIRVSADDTARSHAVRVNITLNSNGRGTHRILARGRDDLPPAWTAYDPAAALQSLRAARLTISDCFWKRDDDGNVVLDGRGLRVPGLHERNGKSRKQFQFDLGSLAKVGNRLYNEMIQLLRPESGEGGGIAWERELRSRLETSGVIQIARIESAPTQYAFPWGLVYEYPLPGPPNRWRWCNVIGEEWSRDGVRAHPIASACPFRNEPWHREDILCPYGFWGLKHVIEQPLAPVTNLDGVVLRDAARDIPVRREINLSIGWTRDSALDLPHIDAHVQNLSGLRGVRLAEPPPNPADDRDTVKAVLAAPNLVYFVCHCEKDAGENQPYLYVGPRDESVVRKIYANTITDWARTTLGEWVRLKPLVFINGCHTGDLEPGEVLNFVSVFGGAGAAGIIGTEVGVQLRVATEVAERLLGKLVASEEAPVGQAMRELRWELANKGNLLGLCYTAYGLADLRFARGGSSDRPT